MLCTYGMKFSDSIVTKLKQLIFQLIYNLQVLLTLKTYRLNPFQVSPGVRVKTICADEIKRISFFRFSFDLQAIKPEGILTHTRGTAENKFEQYNVYVCKYVTRRCVLPRRTLPVAYTAVRSGQVYVFRFNLSIQIKNKKGADSLSRKIEYTKVIIHINYIVHSYHLGP